MDEKTDKLSINPRQTLENRIAQVVWNDFISKALNSGVGFSFAMLEEVIRDVISKHNEPTHLCFGCNEKLTKVREGKYQCDNHKCECN